MKNGHNKTPLLTARGLDVNTAAGRPLFRNLNLSMTNERVAIIGRNGVGKSTLLDVLTEQTPPLHGTIQRLTDTLLVPQHLAQPPKYCPDAESAAIGLRPHHERFNTGGFSRGEQRKLALLAAKRKHPGLLLLDEPTQDLDNTGLQWLHHWLSAWSNGLILVSHDPRLLRHFTHFLVITESGCRYFKGCFEALQRDLERDTADSQKKYLHHLHTLVEQEAHNAQVTRRRQRKKNRGRVGELGRMTSRMRLNTKRSYAQCSQGKADKVRELRIAAVRDWVKATRRALTVSLPMAQLMPKLPKDNGEAIITADNLSASRNGHTCFKGINLIVHRERIGILGQNGAGKTTLLRTLLGQHPAKTGTVVTRLAKVGTIAQGASDWMLEDSLLENLLTSSNASSPETAAHLLVGHQFPLALAERPLKSLSPGERVRAALICLLAKSPAVECLVLDEPTNSLDFVGYAALQAGLKTWPGGWVIASHDPGFLQDIGVDRCVSLDGTCA